MKRFDLPQDDGRQLRARPRVKIHREIDIRPQPLPQHLHVFHRAGKVAAGLHPLQQVGQLELQRRHPRLPRLVAQRARFFQRPCRGMIISAPAPRIHRAAQQFVHRHSENLPG